MFNKNKKAQEMTREDIKNEVLSLKGNNWLLELPTGTGKSKIALDKIKYLHEVIAGNPFDSRMLIVVPRNVHKQNWEEEIKKWWPNNNLLIEYTTYVSFPKHKGYWEYMVFDECFKGTTEILTEKGFKRFDSLDGTEEVAQFNKNGSIEFVKPIRFIKKYYTGELCKVTLGRARNVYMTPNHQQVYRTIKNQEWRTKSIKDLNLKGYTYIPVSGESIDTGEELNWLEKLLIAIQADGTLQRHQLKESVYSIQVTKQRKKNRLAEILSHLDNYTTIKSREETDRYMVKLPKGDAKLLSTHFSVKMGKIKAKQFIEEVVKWDGSESMGDTLYYSSAIKENVDFVNAIAVQAGYKVLQSIEKDNRKDSYSDIYRLYMRKNTKEVHTSMNKEYIPYSDYVYCVEVPSHMIVVRSEGYTFISGNCHHLSERCREALCDFNIDHAVLLSATVNNALKDELKEVFDDLVLYKKDLRDVIEEEILPDPRVYLWPLELKAQIPSEYIFKNTKAKGTILECNWIDRWKFIKQKNYPVRIYCTERQYYTDLCGTIEYWKGLYLRSRSIIAKNKWLKLCNDRLKWLSDKKISYVRNLLFYLRCCRTLTFCNSIEQTEKLGEYCINSKNKDSINNYKMFNEGKIDHITACNMLNESMNLINCQVGIYANLNSSETIVKQRMGRLLRHPNPVIIVPYYKNTREEELIQKMLEDYNPELVTTITDIKEIKI